MDSRKRDLGALSLQQLHDLGVRIDEGWRALDYDESRFPALASEILEQSDEVAAIDPEEVLQWLSRSSTLPPQSDSASLFSDLALTLFQTGRFNVSLLFWLDGSTAIHQHQFCGAFRVVSGSSLHTSFRFHEERKVNRRYRLGSLERESVELLPTGSVRPIESGGGFIHSLFHLDRPSLSLVVRTGFDPGTAPQWSFLEPGIAFDPFYSSGIEAKHFEALGILVASNPEAGLAELQRYVGESDLQLCHQAMTRFAHAGEDSLSERFGAGRPSTLELLTAAARPRHGEAVDRIAASIEWSERLNEIHRMRGQLTRAEERFLLALLLNFPGRERALALLQERYPDRDPAEEFANRVEALASTRALDTKETNLLGTESFDLEHRIVLRRILLDGNADSAADDLATELGETPADASKLADQIVSELRETRLLRELFPPASAA